MLKKLALCAVLFASTATADTVPVNTYSGMVDVVSMPQTIAVFDVSAVDTLAALGVFPDGTVSNLYVDYLDASSKEAVTVGSLFEPDFEAVNALAPDLIIAGGRSAKQVDALGKIAPTIDMTIWEDVPGQGLDRLKAFGDIFGKQAEAADLADQFQAKIEMAKVALADKGNALIVMTNGPKVSAYGAAGRFGWLHNSLDLPEAVKDTEDATHGEAISFEFIADANPDILIVIDRLSAIGKDGQNAKTTLDNALVHGTKAWSNDNVIYLDAAQIYIAGGGIQSMNHTLDQIISAFSGS